MSVKQRTVDPFESTFISAGDQSLTVEGVDKPPSGPVPGPTPRAPPGLEELWAGPGPSPRCEQLQPPPLQEPRLPVSVPSAEPELPPLQQSQLPPLQESQLPPLQETRLPPGRSGDLRERLAVLSSASVTEGHLLSQLYDFVVMLQHLRVLENAIMQTSARYGANAWRVWPTIEISQLREGSEKKGLVILKQLFDEHLCLKPCFSNVLSETEQADLNSALSTGSLMGIYDSSIEFPELSEEARTVHVSSIEPPVLGSTAPSRRERVAILTRDVLDAYQTLARPAPCTSLATKPELCMHLRSSHQSLAMASCVRIRGATTQ